jgi:hypothetical protein
MSRRTFSENKTPGIQKNPAPTLVSMTVIMNTKHRSSDTKVSKRCTRMLPFGNINIMIFTHQDNTLELPHERQHHVLGMTAIDQRPQTFTIMMLQDCTHTKPKKDFEIENLLILNKVNLLNL